MNKQCVNCPGANDHTTAECPVMCEVSAPIDPIHSAMMLGITPEPCEPIIEITRQAVTKLLDVVEFGDQLERVEKDRLVAFVKELLAEEQPQLWAMHSVGPNEVHPMISKEFAEKQAAELIKLCNEHCPDVPINVHVIPSPYSPLEHFEILAEELTEQVASLSEALEKKVEAPAPAVAMPPDIPRNLLGKIVDEVFDGAIEDPSVIEDVYRVIARERLTGASLPVGVPDVGSIIRQLPTGYFANCRRGQEACRESVARLVETELLAAAPAAQPAAEQSGAGEQRPMSELIRQHRIAITPEHEGQWHADLYGREAEPLARAEGATPEAAVAAVVALYHSLQEQQP